MGIENRTLLRKTGATAGVSMAGLVALSLAALTLTMAGCDQDLPKLSLIDEMDIFGAQVRVADDETRATPMPGETATMELSVVYPHLDADEPANDAALSIAVLECTYPDRFLSIPFCQELVDLASGNDGAPTMAGFELPEGGAFDCDQDRELSIGTLTLRCLRGKRAFDFTVDPDFEAERRLFLGIVCRNGIAQPTSTVTSPGNLFTCRTNNENSKKLEQEAFYASATVRQPTDKASADNHNPSLAELELRLDDRPWPALPAGMIPSLDACGSTLLAIGAGEKVEFALTIPDSEREPVDDSVEDLRITHAATAGQFERAVSFITDRRKADSDGNLAMDVAWTAPTEAEDGPMLVRFHVGIRDGRGGFATTERFACVR